MSIQTSKHGNYLSTLRTFVPNVRKIEDFNMYRKGEEEKQEEDLQEIRQALESLQQDREKLDSIQNPHR
jgi:hypothetical protein